jgi:hypothetical protein
MSEGTRILSGGSAVVFLTSTVLYFMLWDVKYLANNRITNTGLRPETLLLVEGRVEINSLLLEYILYCETFIHSKYAKLVIIVAIVSHAKHENNKQSKHSTCVYHI